MGDVAAFFDHLNRHGAEFLPAKVNGTLRFDLTGGDRVEHWLVVVKKGNVFVSQEEQEADVVLTADAGLFGAIASGEANLVAAMLRNQAVVEGSLPLLLAFRRALPPIPGAHDPRQAVAIGGKRR